MDSILTSIKKMLGITEDDTAFDTDIIIHVNSVFMILSQLGVGPDKGFTIKDSTDAWVDFECDEIETELIKSYMYLKVKLLFDPPSNSSVLESINNQINELEWRLNFNSESNTTS